MTSVYMCRHPSRCPVCRRPPLASALQFRADKPIVLDTRTAALPEQKQLATAFLRLPSTQPRQWKAEGQAGHRAVDHLRGAPPGIPLSSAFPRLNPSTWILSHPPKTTGEGIREQSANTEHRAAAHPGNKTQRRNTLTNALPRSGFIFLRLLREV